MITTIQTKLDGWLGGLKIAVRHGKQFKSVLRTSAQKEPLRAICESCQFNVSGDCTASKCCGGKLSVEVLLNLDTTKCPKGFWD